LVAETALHRRYVQRLTRVRAGTLARVLAADTASTTAFVERVVPIVLASQEATVSQADAYLSAEAGIATRTSTEPWGLNPAALIGRRARRGDWLEDVYARNHRASESTFAERMAREVNTDVTLAERAANYVHTDGDPRITGYRRVLSAGKNCGLCVAAATQRYGKGDLRPIHRACGCTTQPIYGGAGGYRKPSKSQLNALYEKAGGTDFKSLRRIQVDQADLPDVAVVDTDLGPTLIRVPEAA
jgi:hypothetical protein